MKTLDKIEEIVREFRRKFGELDDTIGSIDIEQFFIKSLNQIRQETIQEMDVSKWKELGKELKYWDYFRKQIIQECLDIIEEYFKGRIMVEDPLTLKKELLQNIKNKLNKEYEDKYDKPTSS